MLNRLIVFVLVLGSVTAPAAFAQNPIRCGFLVDGQTVGAPEIELRWGASAYAFVTDAGLQLTAALTGCPDACLDGASYAALDVSVAQDGKVIAQNHVTPVDSVDLVLEASAQKAKIWCQAVPDLKRSPEGDASDIRLRIFDLNSVESLNIVSRGVSATGDGLHLDVNWPMSAPDTHRVVPRGATECRHGGISAMTNPGFDLQPGESCLFQTSAMIVQIALKPTQGRKVELKVTGYPAGYK